MSPRPAAPDWAPDLLGVARGPGPRECDGRDVPADACGAPRRVGIGPHAQRAPGFPVTAPFTGRAATGAAGNTSLVCHPIPLILFRRLGGAKPARSTDGCMVMELAVGGGRGGMA